MAELKERLLSDMKVAMKAKDKDRLATIRMALAEIKQREVDGQEALTDAAVVAVIDKMIKQRRDSAEQYDKGGRDDLASAERSEIEVLQEYLPQPLSDDEVDELIERAVEATGAASMKDMGQVMNMLRPQVQGRADMQKVSEKVRAQLSA